MIRHTLIALVGLAILFGTQVDVQAQTTINFLPTGEGDWGTSTNWSDPNMVGQHVPQSPFDEIVTIGTGGTAIVSGAFTNATDPAGPAAINLNAGTLRIQNPGQLTVFPSGFGSPGADGHVTVNGRLNVQGGGKLNASILNFSSTSIFDVHVTSATASPVTVESTVLLGGTLALDYSGLPAPVGKRTLITTTSGFVLGNFSNVVTTGLGTAQRALVNTEGAGKLLTANVVNVPTVSIDRQSGVATITNTHSTPISLDGIAFRSPLGAFTASQFTGLGSGWTTAPNNSSTAVGQAYEGTLGTPAATLAAGASVQVGGAMFFKTPLPTAFLQETEDVFVEVTNPTMGATPARAVVNYTGTKVVNNTIALAIDPTTGQARLKNVTAFTQEVDAYRIRSTGSPLLTTWTGMVGLGADDGTWRKSTQSNASALIEVQEGGATTFDNSQIYNLGQILNTGFAQSGITFEFLLAGQDQFTPGGVIFGDFPNITFPNFGDFNGNGTVDAADYAVWRNNLNQPEGNLLSGNGNGGTIDQSDYLLWKQNFGTVYSGAGSVQSTTVPEPSAMALLGVAIAASCVLRGRSF